MKRAGELITCVLFSLSSLLLSFSLFGIFLRALYVHVFYLEEKKMEAKKGKREFIEREEEKNLYGLIDFVVTGLGRTMNQVVLECHPCS